MGHGRYDILETDEDQVGTEVMRRRGAVMKNISHFAEKGERVRYSRGPCARVLNKLVYLMCIQPRALVTMEARRDCRFV